MKKQRARIALSAPFLGCLLLSAGCDSGAPKCQRAAGSIAPAFLERIGCVEDFQALASISSDISVPGARSGKVMLDTWPANLDHLYFQNGSLYPIHHQFASAHLGAEAGLPTIEGLSAFNNIQYSSPERRFILGTVNHYEAPNLWTLEIAPYDTASAEMITRLYEQVRSKAFFGPQLAFYPTSEPVAAVAATLPSTVKVATTDDLYRSLDYQPRSVAVGVGRLRFVQAANIETAMLSSQDLVVLDAVPDDIIPVRGIISAEFQPLRSRANVLAANRHVPTMGLRDAMINPTLRALEGKLVELRVGAAAWSIREVMTETPDPPPLTLPPLDLTVKTLVDIQDVTVETPGVSLRDAINTSVRAYGVKAAHYSVLVNTPGVPIKKAFAIPMYFYDQFMRTNGLYALRDSFLRDPAFVADANVRKTKLADLRRAMVKAPVDPDFQALVKAKLASDHPGTTIRFRTSTNSDDIDGFRCPNCYESHTGDPANWDSILAAIRLAYASTYLFAPFEERAYRGIDENAVGMALLVHQNFPDEEANGVAITNNVLDPSGLDAAFYVNVQTGGSAEVVHQSRGVINDQLLLRFDQQDNPVTYVSHSNIPFLREPGTDVLTHEQLLQLGTALDAIHQRFSAAYGPLAGQSGFFAMECEFKYDNDANPTLPPSLYVKQARLYAGPGRDIADNVPLGPWLDATGD